MRCRSAGMVLSFFIVALCSPLMAQPGPAPGPEEAAGSAVAVRKTLEFGYILPAKEDSEGGSAGEGVQVLEDGSIFQDPDWQAQDADDRALAFGLGTPQADYRVATGGTHALYAAKLEDLGTWAIRVARATPADQFMVLLDPERARVFAYHEGQRKYLPVLWVDRDGHWVAFHWQGGRGAGGEGPVLLATEEAGRGVRFAGEATQPEESLAPADSGEERKDGPVAWDGSAYWIDFYGKDPDGTGPGSSQADALQRRLAGIQQRGQAVAGGPAAFVPPGQEGAAPSGAGAGVGADVRRFVGRVGDGLLDGAAAVHVGIQRIPVLGDAYAGGARLGEAISGQRVEFSSYAAGPSARELSLDERRQAAFDGTVRVGTLVAAGAVPASTVLRIPGGTMGSILQGAGGTAVLQQAQVAVSGASVAGAGAAAAMAMMGPGVGGEGGRSESAREPRTETKGRGEGPAHGGGRNAQHTNQDARNVARNRYQEAKDQYDSLRPKTNKTPDEKAAMREAKRRMDHFKKKIDQTGENHSRTPKGNR